ncbi:MAG: hypothetical protein ACLRTZ_02880 [Agathobacter sp.]|jgi:hypothetical protein
MQKYRNRFERMTIPRQKTEIRRPIADLRQTAPIMAVGELAAMERKRKYVIQVADSGTHALRDIRSERRTNAQSNTEGVCNTYKRIPAGS